jgi:nicotinate-nucleotide adenylyltransferase
MKRVGIYAGSFDPIHNGHVAFALQAMQSCKLDKVFFLPEPRPRYKQGVKALAHRVAMVRLAIENQPNLGLIELDQTRFYVTDTLPALQARFQGAELYFLLGDDKLKRMIHWPHVGDITSQASFIIGSRVSDQDSVETVAQQITASGGPVFRYTYIELGHHDVTSSKIRQSIKRGRKTTDIDPKVMNYIEQAQLYKSASTE